MSNIRHWKQTFDPDADFVYTKRKLMGLDPENPYVNPGDLVDKSAFNIHRLKMWWKCGFIALADWKSPDEVLRDAQTATAAITGRISPTGRGWFAVTLSDGSVKKIRGEDKAKEFLAGTLCMS